MTQPTAEPPTYEGPSDFARLSQEYVTYAVRRLFDRYREAEEAERGLQAVADHAQDAANDAERHKDDIARKIQELGDAIRAKRPDLTIPEP